MADRYKDLLGEAKALFDGARAILEDKEAPPEKKARVREMVADANAKKDEALALKSILDSGIEEAVALATKDDTREKPEDKAASGTVGDPRKGKNDGFDNWGSFLFKVWEAGHPNVKGPPDSRLTFFKDEVPSGTEKKDMVESVGSSGGFLVPTEFQTQMLQFQATTSIVRPRATVIPMRRRQLELPVLDQTDTTAGQPHWFGGLRFYWEEEAAQKIESDVKFRRLTLVVNKLIGYTRASDELVDDSAVSLDAFLNGPLGFAGGACLDGRLRVPPRDRRRPADGGTPLAGQHPRPPGHRGCHRLRRRPQHAHQVPPVGSGHVGSFPGCHPPAGPDDGALQQPHAHLDQQPGPDRAPRHPDGAPHRLHREGFAHGHYRRPDAGRLLVLRHRRPPVRDRRVHQV
jgi:hypothetical protein